LSNINSSLNILIVEDETNLGDTLYDYLDSKGFNCKLETTIESAKERFLSEDFKTHVLLLDINLPDGNGLDLARELREIRQDFVLLFLSAMNDPETKFEGLNLGAEDYITKPFDLRELNLRLNRIIENKHRFENQLDEVQLQDLKIWFTRFEVEDAQKNIIKLSQKECAILELLYENKNIVISRDEIIEKVWGKNSFPSNRTVDNYIVKLRKWIETSNSNSIEISSIRGIGYKFKITV
jgi:two-component system alkaline phosphatase synthesis response regulator PhoP